MKDVDRRKMLGILALGGGALVATAASSKAPKPGGGSSGDKASVKTTTTTQPPTTTTIPATTTTQAPATCELPNHTVTGTTSGFTVPAGQIWRISGTVISLGSIVVNGKLCARGGDHLKFRGITANYVGGSADPLPIATDIGLWVLDEGCLDFQGTPKQAWMHDSVPGNWNASDPILIAPVALSATTATLSTVGAQALPIPAIQRNSGAWAYAEVTNLGQDCSIEADAGYSAHVFVRSSVAQIIKSVQVTDGGFGTTATGRYPIHFHMCMMGAMDSELEDIVVNGGRNHAFVTHMSHMMTWTRCAGVNVVNDAFWWDPNTGTVNNATDDVLYQDCLAMMVNGSEERLSGFKMAQGMRNSAVGCHAVGVRIINSQKSQAGFGWPENPGGGFPGTDPDSGVWTMTDCVSHHCANGTFEWQNDGSQHDVVRLLTYRNRGAGVQHGAYFNNYNFIDYEFLEEVVGSLSHSLTHLPPTPRSQVWTGVIDGRGRSGAIAVKALKHSAAGDPVIFNGVWKGVADGLVLTANAPSGGVAHEYDLTGVDMSAVPSGHKIVWVLPLADQPAGSFVTIGGTTYTVGMGL